MELLKEIARSAGVDRSGKTVYRQAVRGIILRGRSLFMVYSPVNGDYKFPGGGVNDGESHQQTLCREVREECGAVVSRVGLPFGKVVEFDQAKEAEFDVFEMTSYYYLCEVAPELHPQQLEGYESDFRFEPVWVDIDEAIRNNEKMLETKRRAMPKWTVRDTFVLGQIRERLANGRFPVEAKESSE